MTQLWISRGRWMDGWMDEVAIVIVSPVLLYVFFLLKGSFSLPLCLPGFQALDFCRWKHPETILNVKGSIQNWIDFSWISCRCSHLCTTIGRNTTFIQVSVFIMSEKPDNSWCWVWFTVNLGKVKHSLVLHEVTFVGLCFVFWRQKGRQTDIQTALWKKWNSLLPKRRTQWK